MNPKVQSLLVLVIPMGVQIAIAVVGQSLVLKVLAAIGALLSLVLYFVKSPATLAYIQLLEQTLLQAAPQQAMKVVRNASAKASKLAAGVVSAIVMAFILVACSGALNQQALQAAYEVGECISGIVLDVTGMGTEDPVQIAATCGAAVQDVWNFVNAEIQSIQSADGGAVVVTDAGGTTATYRYSAKTRRYYTEPQFQKMIRIRDNAAKLLADGGAK